MLVNKVSVLLVYVVVIGVCLSRSSIEGVEKKSDLWVFWCVRVVLWFILVLGLYVLGGGWFVGCCLFCVFCFAVFVRYLGFNIVEGLFGKLARECA